MAAKKKAIGKPGKNSGLVSKKKNGNGGRLSKRTDKVTVKKQSVVITPDMV